LPFLLEHVVAVNGEIRRPGGYPITTGTPLSSLIAVAGGMTRDADLSRPLRKKANPRRRKSRTVGTTCATFPL